MHTVLVRTNLRCNQRCGFCHARADSDDPAYFGPEPVIARVAQALEDDPQNVVLSGGEPLLRDDIHELVTRASDRGSRSVWLETNGMLLAYPHAASKLAAAGLHGVIVALNAVDTQSDALTSRPGGFRYTSRGIAEAIGAGLAVQISVAITAKNLRDVRLLPGEIGRRFGPQQGLPGVAGVVARVVTEAPPGWVARLDDMIGALEGLAIGCREAGLPLRIDPAHALPPCALPRRRRFPELVAARSIAAGGSVRIDACGDCAAQGQCPGVPLAIAADSSIPELVPLDETAARWLLARAQNSGDSELDGILSTGRYVDADGEHRDERVVRVNFHCNQACTFCFVDRTRPPVTAGRVQAEIERAAADGVGLLSLSGGEPTLDPRLADHVRLAKSLGLRTQIQTNAIQCAEQGYAAALADAGLDEAFVSLHGATAGVSDAITRRPGTFDETLIGTAKLLDAGVNVRLNCVITGANARQLAAIPDLVHDRFGRRAELVFSWASASTGLVPVRADITPRASAVVRFLVAAVDRAEALGLSWRGLDGECGVPLCVLPAELRPLDRVPTLRTVEPPDGFEKTAVCDGCALGDRCPGVRSSYVALHGTDELAAVTLAAASSA